MTTRSKKASGRGLAGKLIAAMSIIVATTLGSAVVGVLFVREFTSTFQDLSETQVPAVRLAGELSEAVGSLVSAAGAIGNARNETDQETAYIGYTATYDKLTKTLGTLKTLSSEKESLNAIDLYGTQLKDLIEQQNKLTTQRLQLADKQADQMSELRTRHSKLLD
ncbi:hypothetical protein VZ95_03850, partial [Elstera litoralis]